MARLQVFESVLFVRLDRSQKTPDKELHPLSLFTGIKGRGHERVLLKVLWQHGKGMLKVSSLNDHVAKPVPVKKQSYGLWGF